MFFHVGDFFGLKARRSPFSAHTHISEFIQAATLHQLKGACKKKAVDVDVGRARRAAFFRVHGKFEEKLSRMLEKFYCGGRV